MSTIPWHRLFALGAAVSLTAACTVNSGDDAGDDDDDGTSFTASNTSNTNTSSGGSTSTSSTSSGSGGGAGETSTTATSTGGASATTTTGTGGTGGEMLECLETETPTGEPGACENLDPEQNSCCTRCAASKCCNEFSLCMATGPANVCGGTDGTDGEIAAIQACMVENEGLPGLDGDDFNDCVGKAVEEASSPLCDLGSISGETSDLAVCLHGNDEGLNGCFEECFTDFDEESCIY